MSGLVVEPLSDQVGEELLLLLVIDRCIYIVHIDGSPFDNHLNDEIASGDEDIGDHDSRFETSKVRAKDRKDSVASPSRRPM